MGNKRIITYAAAVWLAFSFVSTDMIVRAYEANEPVMLESETPNIEEVEDRPDLLLSEQDSLNEAEEIIVEESVSSTTLEGAAEAVPSVRPVWPGGGGEIKDTTAEAPQIVTHPEVFPYVIAGTDYETPVYTCSARLPEGIMQGKITYTWYVDENVAADSITAYHFIDLPETFTWQKGESTGITVTADGDLELVFTGIMIDGKEIDAKSYLTQHRSTIVTLPAEYLNTLESGNHTLKLLFSNDTDFHSNVEMIFTIIQIDIQESDNPIQPSKNSVSPASTPNTGVNDNQWLWIISGFLSVYGMVEIWRKRMTEQ